MIEAPTRRRAVSPVSWILVPLCFAPAIMALTLVLTNATNVPVFDQWMPDIAGMFVKAEDGQLRLGDFLAQHNEHRIIIPRLIYFILGSLGDWNTVREMVVEWMTICATSLGILWLIARRWNRLLEPATVAKWLVCNLFIFIPAQWENMLSGMGLCNVMPALFLVAGLIIASSKMHPWIKTIWAMLAAGAAMLSLGNGLLAWPLVGIVLAWSESWEQFKAKRWMLALWLATFVVLAVLYAVGFNPAPKEARDEAYFSNPFSLLFYLVNFLGNGFVWTSRYPPVAASAVTGSVMLLTFLGAVAYFIWSWRWARNLELCDKMIVWLAIGGYAVLSGAIAALFRAGIGAAQADASRYVTFSLYLMVALINLVPMIGADWQRHRAETSQGASIWRDLQVGLATVSILLYVLTLPGSFHDFGAQGRVLRQTKAALLMINLFPANPQLKKRLTFDPPATLVVATRLSEKGLLHPPLIASRDVSTFQDTSPAAPTGSFGQIENYGQSGNRILVVGQALQPGASRSADLVFLTYEDDAGRQFVLALAELGKIPAEQEPIPNEDPELALSHWAAEIPLERLPRQLKPPALRAWELDVQTGKAIQLGGAVQTQIAPAN